MATLRQKEIDEILNNDRTMNRRVLDRTISQVASFNDERSAPNTQDIKLEAIVGNLVDNLKASIAEALKLIAAKQFPKTTISNAPAILNKNVGTTGSTAAPPNEQTQEKLDNSLGSAPKQYVPEFDENGQPIIGKGKPMHGGDRAFETAILKGKRKNIDDNDLGNQGYRITSSLPESYQKRLNDDLEYLDSEEEEPVEGGYCGMGFGIRRTRRRRMTGGDNDKPTMKSATVAKSTMQTENSVENALYSIVNQYNSIVDVILQSTRQGGVLKNKRLASASIISFFSNVLQGLVDPLKHLLYELGLVKDNDVASMWTMMKSLVDNVQNAPPFQKVDFRIYRTPATDYQRLNRDLRIDDFDGKIADLKTKGDELEASLKNLHKDASHIEYAMKDKPKEYVADMKKRLYDKQIAIMDAIKQNKEDMQYVTERKKTGLPYDSKALEDTTRDILTNSKVLPVVVGVSSLLTPEMTHRQLYDRKEDIKASLNHIQKQADALENKAKNTVLTEQEVEVLKALAEASESLGRELENVRKQYRAKPPSTKSSKSSLPTVSKEEMDNIKKQRNQIETTLNTTFAKDKEAKEKEAQQAQQAQQPPAGEPAKIEQADNSEAKGKPVSGKGKPLADLLAKPKQQYNSMQRPITDDDKAHKEVVARNQKWQVSNPIHATPIGSKNPFYAQQPDAKYDFRTVLGKENSILYPKQNALGADVSLLQGEIGGPSEQAKEKRKYKKSVKETRTEAEALRNILNQDVYEGGSKKQPGSLRKLVFEDEDNDLFDEEELPVNKGFIKEDKDDKFKLPDIKKEQAKKRKGRL